MLAKVSTNDVREGMKLGKPAYAPSGQLLLPAGIKLTERVRRTLRKWECKWVFVILEGNLMKQAS